MQPPHSLDISEYIRAVPDFPSPGILFRDITPLLANADAFSATVAQMACLIPKETTALACIESRGFIFGAALAHQLDLAFVPVRKPGKLPAATYAVEYALEYGTDRLEIHQDAIEPGQKVVIIDDLLATGGTAAATVQLLRQFDRVEATTLIVLIELDGLKGREKLPSIDVRALIHYD